MGLTPTIVESDNDSIEFNRGFAHGATSSLPGFQFLNFLVSDLPNITVLDFFKACNPFKPVRVRSLTNTCYITTSGLNNVIIDRQ